MAIIYIYIVQYIYIEFNIYIYIELHDVKPGEIVYVVWNGRTIIYMGFTYGKS
jgi:hypothetical protein